MQGEQQGFTSGGGAVGALLRAHDWSRSPLGEPRSWPAALRTVVNLLLDSKFPMFVAWGGQLGLLYNDGYAQILGDKHPASLGAPLRDVWPEIWKDIEPLIAAALVGKPSHYEELPLLVNRRGSQEQASFDFSYSPVRDDSGAVAGMFCAVTETTQQVGARRRQAFRLTLEERLRDSSSPVDLMAAAAEVLGREVGAARTGYGEMDPTGKHLMVEADWSDGSLPSLLGPLKMEVLGSELIREFASGAPLAVTDVLLDPRLGPAAAAFTAIGVRSTLAVPLVKSGEFVALLYVHAKEPRVWDPDELRLTREVAERTWAVVERARAETLLRDREELLRLAIEAAEVGLWNLDMQSRELLWSARVKAMFGISPDVDATLDDFLAGIHRDDYDRVHAAFHAAADPVRRPPYDIEYRAIGKEDGKLRWIAVKGRAMFDEDGRCVRVVGTTVDITRRKADESRLRELNETLERRFAETLAERKLLADIVEGTDIFVQVADLDFNWLAINRASAEEFARIFGVPRPRAGDNMLRALDGSPHQTAVRTVWARALGGEEFVETGRFGDEEHSARHYEMRFRTLRDEAGRIVGAYQFVHDVTARLREQARLRDAEAALRQVQKMEAVGQLTGGIAHDFNNLLSAIVGNFELVKARPDDVAWVRRFAQAGLQVAERGARLTGQLLAFSRSQRLELKALAVADVVSGMRDMLSRTLGPMIHLQLELDAAPLAVMSDATQLEMALLNLAINARDAMPGGGVLTIGSRLQHLPAEGGLPAGDYVEISVTDTGVGMPPDVLAHAFDPFFTTKGVGEGTGLGLSQVYAIARQAGGDARIDSRMGHGTTVRLLLPSTAAPLPERRSANDTALQSGSVMQVRVLVVDDDADIRAVLRALLETLGYEVLEAEDGRAGLAQLEQHAPDLMMVDFAMPGMNGADVARAARASRPDLPIVFASGYADTAAIEDVPGPRSPMLRKPFAVDELQRVLKETLKPGRRLNKP